MTPEYLAGLFDGEGCIDVQTLYPSAPSAKGKLYLRPRVRMCMSDNTLYMMQLLHTAFGGHLVRRKSTSPTQQASWSLEWLNQKAMKKLLNTILPHLILKREQAKLVLWWLDNASGRQSNNGFPGMEQARYAFKNEMQAMKRDPQRLSERAAKHIASLMRQSEHTGDRVTPSESVGALA
jgi:hypothetical protein